MILFLLIRFFFLMFRVFRRLDTLFPRFLELGLFSFNLSRDLLLIESDSSCWTRSDFGGRRRLPLREIVFEIVLLDSGEEERGLVGACMLFFYNFPVGLKEISFQRVSF